MSFYCRLMNLHTAAKLLQSCPTLCDPTDGSPPGSAIPGVLQARTLEWVAISSSREQLLKITNCFFPVYFCCSVAQSCPTLWDSMDSSLPDFSVHAILQARILEWVAISFSNFFPPSILSHLEI